MIRSAKAVVLLMVFMLALGCARFYLTSPLYVLADLFYFMPRSAFDNCDGECKRGVVWFPVTRLDHMTQCS